MDNTNITNEKIHIQTVDEYMNETGIISDVRGIYDADRAIINKMNWKISMRLSDVDSDTKSCMYLMTEAGVVLAKSNVDMSQTSSEDAITELVSRAIAKA